jgi:hypothetical protein
MFDYAVEGATRLGAVKDWNPWYVIDLDKVLTLN